MRKPFRVLHITPHLGGGVGNVVRNLISYAKANQEFEHQIVCLEYANSQSKAWADKTDVKLFDEVSPVSNALITELNRADVVHIHWWNHPLLYQLLFNKKLPPFRSVIWSHVNGLYAPQIFTRAVLSYPNLFVLTTPCSMTAPAIEKMTQEWRDEHLRVVFTSAGIDHVAHIQPQNHQTFNVGYIGTVSYSKMHPHFIEMSLAAQLPDAKFIVCGGDDHEKLRREIASLGQSARFDIKGYVDDIASVLAVLDVFGYPLSPTHYGTGEQVLVEAMAAGVVPVVLDNSCEKYVIEHRKTGWVAKTPGEYSAALEFLYQHPQLRNEMAANAKKNAQEKFDISKTVTAWQQLYLELLDQPKVSHQIKVNFAKANPSLAANQLFLQSLGDSKAAEIYRRLSRSKETQVVQTSFELSTLPDIFRVPTRGSVFHYQRFFSEDTVLDWWSQLTALSIQNENAN